MDVVEKKKRPRESTFTQQSHGVWEPRINFRSLWLPMIVVGVLLCILGSALVYFVSATELVVTYGTHSNCVNCRNKARIQKNPGCKACLPANSEECLCSVQFNVPRAIQTPIMVYYELDNFYQSHRRYVKSRDDSQLLGRILDKNHKLIEPDSSCHPYDVQGKSAKQYSFPCGAIANSMFTDKLTIKSRGIPLIVNKNDIAWDYDVNYKFRNPEGIDKMTYNLRMSGASVAFNKHFRKPISWDERTWQKFWENGGLQNPDFVNWMSPSPLPRMRKFYGRLDSVPTCKDPTTLCPGNYVLEVDYRFTIDPFKGQKSLVLATTSVLGTSNPFIGWFAVGLGIVLCCLSVMFFIFHKLYKKTKVHPHHYRVSVQKPPAPPEDVSDSDYAETETAQDSSRVRSSRDRRSSSAGSSKELKRNSTKKSDSLTSSHSHSSLHRIVPQRDPREVNPKSLKEAEDASHKHLHPHTLSKFVSRKKVDKSKKRAKSAPSKPGDALDGSTDRSKSNPKSSKLKLL